MIILGPRGFIKVFEDKQLALNLYIDVVPGQRNVHRLGTRTQTPPEMPPKTDKPHNPIQCDEGAKRVPLDTALPIHAVLIGEGLAPQEETSLLDCPHRNKDVFA